MRTSQLRQKADISTWLKHKPNYQKYKAFFCSFQGTFSRVAYFNHLSNHVCSNEQGGLL